ncbi:DUF5131 family protein [soil metagenome]
MALNSSIEWTDATWNPVTGCTQVSPGCDHCYAMVFAERFRGTPGHPYEQGFDMRLWESRLEMPMGWKKPRRIFVNSMSDLFHPAVSDDFVHRVFGTMEKADWHIYQILTKRPQRLARMSVDLPWPPNVWMGVSVESNEYVWRADFLRMVPARVRFVSAEPLLGPVDQLDLDGIHWLITGGESGHKSRPCDPDWVRTARDRCLASNVAFFHKQWGGRTSKSGGRELDGKTWNQFPIVTPSSIESTTAY